MFLICLDFIHAPTIHYVKTMLAIKYYDIRLFVVHRSLKICELEVFLMAKKTKLSLDNASSASSKPKIKKKPVSPNLISKKFPIIVWR